MFIPTFSHSNAFSLKDVPDFGPWTEMSHIAVSIFVGNARLGSPYPVTKSKYRSHGNANVHVRTRRAL
eukprot:3474671-Amphidinium_carterae.1